MTTTGEKTASGGDDPLLLRVREIALALPGAKEKVSHGSPVWYTTKTFCWWGAHVRGDHASTALARAISIRPAPPEREALLADPRFHVPAYLGPSGWLALDLAAEPPDWDEVAELIEDSFRGTAGARLVARLPARG